jgi:hypothetical protein
MKKATFSLVMLLFIGIGDLFAQPQFPFEPATPLFPNNAFPFNNANNNRRQVLYLASDFNAPAGLITKIYVKSSSQVLPNFTDVLIQVGFTTATTLTAGGPFFSPVDTVFYSAPASPTRVIIPTGGSWVEFPLTTPILYDGVSNIVMDFSQTGHNPGFAIVNGDLPGRTLYGPRTSTSVQTQGLVAHVGFDMQTQPCASEPVALTLDSANANGDAFVSWMSAGSDWVVEFGPCGFTPGTGQATFVDSNVTNNNGYVIPGLTQGSCGCFFVRERCDSIFSDWSDSLEICNPFDLDAELVQILSPVDGECGATNMNVQLVVRNNGINPLPILPLSVIISGDINDMINMSFPGGLTSFAQDTFSLGSFNSSAGGNISIFASVAAAGDQFPDNDSLSASNIRIPSVNPIDFDVIYLGNLELEFRSNQRFADSTVWDIAGNRLVGDTVSFTFSDPDSVLVCMEVFGNCNSGDVCKNLPTSLMSLDGFASNEIKIYPNPAQTFVEIDLGSLTERSITSVQAISPEGRIIHLQNETTSKLRYSMGSLKPGVYILHIHLDNGEVYQKKVLLM